MTAHANGVGPSARRNEPADFMWNGPRVSLELRQAHRLGLRIAMSTPSDRARWFSEHIQPHEPMLRAWLRGRFEAACDVDDLVQEAYVRVWRAYEHGSV